MQQLSALAVTRLTEPGRHAVGNGVYLQITGERGRSWIFQYERNGKRHHVGLGPTSLVTLAEARAKGHNYRKLLLDGIDPLDQRELARRAGAVAAAKTVTFKECAEQYVASHEAGWRSPRHRYQWAKSLESYAYPVLGPLPVSEIDTGLVMKVVGPLWKHKTETARRVRGRIEAVLDWAKVRELREGENPARWRGHLDHLLPDRSAVAPVEHHAALPYVDIGRFMAELSRQIGMSARALEFVILTAARVNEVLGARWAEIEGDVWVVPRERMKAAKEHRVPLSRAALALLEALPRRGAYVFPGPLSHQPMENSAPLKVLKRMGRRGITAHGFRSSFRDWAAEATAYPNHVVEQALAHSIGNAVEAAYRRGDLFEKRRRLMADWAEFCSRGHTAPAVANIVSLRGRNTAPSAR